MRNMGFWRFRRAETGTAALVVGIIILLVAIGASLGVGLTIAHDIYGDAQSFSGANSNAFGSSSSNGS